MSSKQQKPQRGAQAAQRPRTKKQPQQAQSNGRSKRKGKGPAPVNVMGNDYSKDKLISERKRRMPADSRVMDWVNMMLDPADSPPVLAPCTAGVLASHARIVKGVIIEGTEENEGYFSVCLRPSLIDPLIWSTKAGRFPAEGSGPLQIASVSSFIYGRDSKHPGCPTAGQFSVKTDGMVTETYIGLAPVTDINGLTLTALNVDNAAGSQVVFSFTNRNYAALSVRMYTKSDGGAWVPDVVTHVMGGSTIQLWAGVSTADHWTVVLTDRAGNRMNPLSEFKGALNLTCSNAFIPLPAQAGIVSRFVKDEIVQAANVQNVRVTAASLLATCTSSAMNSGGEIIAACTQQRLVLANPAAPDLMSAIRALGTTNRWASCPAVKGAYSFYAPDDATSYEPSEYTDKQVNDNCIVFVGKLAPGTILRFTATFVVEFYTSSPLFSNAFTPTWDPAFKAALTALQRGPMVSENPDHMEMIKYILRKIKEGLGFALEHKQEIAIAAQLAHAFI